MENGNDQAIVPAVDNAVLYSYSFSEEGMNVLTSNDREMVKQAVDELVETKGKAVRLIGLSIEGDIFLAKSYQLPSIIHAERDQKIIRRICFVDRKDMADAKNPHPFGVWIVEPNRGSEVFLPYW